MSNRLSTLLPLAVAASLGAAPLAAGCAQTNADEHVGGTAPEALVWEAEAPDTSVSFSEETRALYMDAARLAWQFFEENTDPETGLVRATPNYAGTTTWDLGSALGAIHSAHELEIIDEAEYRSRMGRLLDTMERLDLFRGTFHKTYHSGSGAMMDGGSVDPRGYAWSATDLGRLLLWLKGIGQDPEFSDDVEAIVDRLEFSQVVQDGYMHGFDRKRHGGRPFQEGRIGYEQYAAAGFAAWELPVGKALDVMTNAEPRNVLGQRILADRRGLDRLVSEPFVMMGLEIGWTPEIRELAESLLALQESRYRETGEITIASEDAVDVEPHYFYYYCIYCSGEAWVVSTHDPDVRLDGPRWVSTKNAFGWNALLPNEYTELAVDAVSAARSPEGWSSGVFVGSHESTRTRDINTAAMLLESALYVHRGRPILEGVVGR